MQRRRGIALLAAAVIAFATTVVLARKHGGEAQVTFQRPVPAAVAVWGGSAETRHAVERIASRLGPTRLTAVAIRPAGTTWRPFPAGALELRATTRGRETVRGAWEASLLAGALQEDLLEAKLPPVVALVTNGGGGRMIGQPWPPRAVRNGMTRHAALVLARRLAGVAREAGASAVTVTIIRPHGFAFAVQVREHCIRHRFSGVAASCSASAVRWGRRGRIRGSARCREPLRRGNWSREQSRRRVGDDARASGSDGLPHNDRFSDARPAALP